MAGADSIRVVHPLFQAEGGGSIPTSALQLHLLRIKLPLAKQLNALWHSRLPKFTKAGCRACFAAEFDDRYYAVAIWGNPLARKLPQLEWMELQRFAIAPDAPRNTASRALAIMATLIRRNFPGVTRLISYQDMEAHSGTIYKAAGWCEARLSEGGEWTRPSRWERPTQSAAAKQRWDKLLRVEAAP